MAGAAAGRPAAPPPAAAAAAEAGQKEPRRAAAASPGAGRRRQRLALAWARWLDRRARAEAAGTARSCLAAWSRVAVRPGSEAPPALAAPELRQRCRRLVVTHGTILHQHKIGFQLRSLWDRWRQACADARGHRRAAALEARVQELERQLESERRQREVLISEVVGSQARHEEFDHVLEAERRARAEAAERCEELGRALEAERREHRVADLWQAELGERLEAERAEHRAAAAEALEVREQLERLLEAERRDRDAARHELRHREREALLAGGALADLSPAAAQATAHAAAPAPRGRALATERQSSARAIAGAVADGREAWARVHELERAVDAARLQGEAALQRCAELESILEAETKEHKAVIAEALAGQVQLQELAARAEADARGRVEAARRLAEERRGHQAAAARCEELVRQLDAERSGREQLAAQERSARGRCEELGQLLTAERSASQSAVERALRERRPWHAERRSSLRRPQRSSPQASPSPPLSDGAAPRGGVGAAARALGRLPPQASPAPAAGLDAAVPLSGSGGGSPAAAACAEELIRRKLELTPSLSARSDCVSDSPTFCGEASPSQSPWRAPGEADAPAPEALPVASFGSGSSREGAAPQRARSLGGRGHGRAAALGAGR